MNFSHIGSYPHTRMRRTRQFQWLRRLVGENTLTPDDLILPLFVIAGKNKREPIEAMPGVYRYSIDQIIPFIKEAQKYHIPACMLFPYISMEEKTHHCQMAYDPNNLICQSIAAIKDACPDMGIISDIALDPFNLSGHDGLVENQKVINDKTIDVLIKQSFNQVRAGSDILAPSDMMDGRIKKIRHALESEGFYDVPILSYAAKYASHFYGPFRSAIGSDQALNDADKKTYQMSYSNAKEAMREIAMDIEEGADMVMVKPGMPYLDIIRQSSQSFPHPIFAYQVSGEYAMIHGAGEKGWIDAPSAMLESLICFKRAGAKAIVTYAALDVAKQLIQK